MATKKLLQRKRIHRRLRTKISGSAEKPRMAVYRSNKAIYVQLIDDISGRTLMSTSSREKDVASNKGTKVEIAKVVGEKIGKMAVEGGIAEVVFDRGGFLYHGRIKSLADGARGEGLKF